MATRKKHSTRKGSMRKYGRAASKSVESAMKRRNKGTLRSGKSGHGGRVTSRKQAIAIGLSEARREGDKVPALRAPSRGSSGSSSRRGRSSPRGTSSRRSSIHSHR